MGKVWAVANERLGRAAGPVGALPVGLVLGLGLGVVAGAAPAVRAGEPVESALARTVRQLPHAETEAGACVIDLATGRVVFEYNADQPLVPASNMKVFVLAAALDVLGPAFAFRTRLATDGETLYLVGDGDPALGDLKVHRQQGHDRTSDFVLWSQALAQRGRAQFPGGLIIDESIFDAELLHPSWEPSDVGKWYAAPVGALNFNDNCIDVVARPGPTPGARAVVSFEPPCTLVQIDNQCTTGGRSNPILDHAEGGFAYVVRGQCDREWPFSAVPVPDPGLFTSETLRTVFAQQGVEVAGAVQRRRVRRPDGSLPPELAVLAIRVTPLPQMLWRAGKDSQNLFAECLLKRTGYAWAQGQGVSDPQGSWATGTQALRATLVKAGVDPAGFVPADGSGLSRQNRCTARQLAGLLAWMHRQPASGVLRDSLSVAGVDGSLRKRLRDRAGCVVGKTGTMRSVRTLSGYVLAEGRPVYAFAVLYNGYSGPSTPYRALQDRFCMTLADAAAVAARRAATPEP